MMLPTIKTMTSIEYKIAMKMTIMKTKRLIIIMIVIVMIIICTSTTIILIV